MIKISVIIPTFNRCDVLLKCIESLLDQSISYSEYEILTVNDGSTDETKKSMTRFLIPRDRTAKVIYLEQENKGPAAARNMAIKYAKGKYLFFTGDDIIASKDLLNRHFVILESQENIASLGFTSWDRELKVTKFMNFLIFKGMQFDYNGLSDGQNVSWRRFYTSNIFIEARWFRNEFFDERFCYPAWEDIEMGYRLYKKGLRIIFNKKAVAFHHHIITEEAFYHKIRQGYRCIPYFYKKHPEIAQFKPKVIKITLILFVFRNINFYTKILEFFRLYSLAWYLNIGYHINLGIKEGLDKRSYQSYRLPS